MSVLSKSHAEKSRFALRIKGIQDEYGVAEYVFSFEASLDALSNEIDLCSIKGMLIEHERGDLCVRIANAKADVVETVSFDIYRGAKARYASTQGFAIQAPLQGESILFLYDPVVNDLEDGKMPGTRLIASLRKHFSGRDLQIVLDLGTPDEDTSFRDYFFSELDLLDLHFLDHRLALGRWGKPKESQRGTFTFTAIYE